MERRLIIRALFALSTGMILLPLLPNLLPHVYAEQPFVLEDVPLHCNNNRGLNAKTDTFYVGPLWLRKCENVCEFKKGNSVVGRKTVWYAPTVCGGKRNSVILRVDCLPDTRKAGCFRPEIVENDPRNHNCRNNPGDHDACITVEKVGKCNYNMKNEGGGERIYSRRIPMAECGRKNSAISLIE